MPNSTVLRWRVCCRGQPPFRTCPCLFVSVFVLVRQGHCGKCEPECHVEVHFGAVRLVETRRLRVWRTVSCIAPAWLRRRYRRSLPRIFFYGWGTSDNFLSTWPVFVWSDVYTPFSCSSSIIFFVREVLSFFFFFFLIEVCRQYRNTKPGLVSQCVGASTRPVRQTWQLSFIFHPELISYSSHAGHSGNGSFPPQPLLHDSYFLNFSCNVFYKPQPPSGMY